MQQRKSWIVLIAAFLVLGLAVGWFSASRIAAKDNERYTTDWLSYARYVQAKERATLVRLLADKQIQKAEDVLYVALASNFKEYASSSEGEERKKACELLSLLGANFVASTQQTSGNEPKSTHRVLAESIRAATKQCGDVK